MSNINSIEMIIKTFVDSGDLQGLIDKITELQKKQLQLGKEKSKLKKEYDQAKKDTDEEAQALDKLTTKTLEYRKVSSDLSAAKKAESNIKEMSIKKSAEELASIKAQENAFRAYTQVVTRLTDIKARFSAVSAAAAASTADFRQRLELASTTLRSTGSATNSVLNSVTALKIAEGTAVNATSLFTGSINMSTKSLLELGEAMYGTSFSIDYVNSLMKQNEIQLEANQKQVLNLERALAELEKTQQTFNEMGIRMGTETMKDYNNQLEDTKTRIVELTQQQEIYKKMSSALKETREEDIKSSKRYNAVTLQTSQVLRELPNFFIDARIGILSLTNNLPYFFESFEELTRSAKVAAVTAGKTFNTLDKGKLIVSQVAKSLFSFNALIVLGTILLTAFSDEVIGFFSNLGKGERKLADFGMTLNYLIKGMDGATSSAVSNVEAILELGIAIKKYKEGVGNADAIIKKYNETLGKNYGTLKDINDVLIKYPQYAKDYVNWSIKMASSQLAIADAAKYMLNVEQARTKIKLYDDKTVNEVYKNMLAMNDLLEKLGYSQKQIYDFYMEEDVMSSAKSAVNLTRVLLSSSVVSTSAQRDALTYASEFLKVYKDFTETKGANEVAQTLIALGKNKRLVEAARKSALSLFPGLFDTGDTKPPKTDFNPSDLKDTPQVKTAELIAREVINWEEWKTEQIIALENENYSELTKIGEIADRNIAESRKKTLGNFLTGGELDPFKQIAQDVEVLNAALDDNQREVEKTKKRLDELKNYRDLFIQETQNLNEQYDAYDRVNRQLTENVNNLESLKIKLDEAKKAYDDSDNPKQAEERKKVVKALEEQVASTEDLVSANENTLEIISNTIDATKEQLKTYKEGSKEYEDLTKKLIDLGFTRDQIEEMLHRKEIDRQKEKQKMLKDYAKALGDLFGGIADLYQSDLDATNKEYDSKKEMIENNVSDEASRNKQLAQLEEERYKALKDSFEKQKQFKIAQAWMDFASGAIGIWTAPGITSLAPFGQILAGIQTAALLATTIANVQTISQQTLEAPKKPSITSSSGGSGFAALTPQKAALTTSQENLNMITGSVEKPENVVRVSEIDNVSANVKVRENRLNY